MDASYYNYTNFRQRFLLLLEWITDLRDLNNNEILRCVPLAGLLKQKYKLQNVEAKPIVWAAERVWCILAGHILKEMVLLDMPHVIKKLLCQHMIVMYLGKSAKCNTRFLWVLVLEILAIC